MWGFFMPEVLPDGPDENLFGNNPCQSIFRMEHGEKSFRKKK
jgi:hypothetical protein